METVEITKTLETKEVVTTVKRENGGGYPIIPLFSNFLGFMVLGFMVLGFMVLRF